MSVSVGFVVLVILGIAADLIVGAVFIGIPLSHGDAQTYITFSLVLRPLCSMVGGCVAALIGRRRELGVTYALAVVGAGVAAVFLLWDRGTRLPLWFDLVQVAEIAAGVLIGGYLTSRRTNFDDRPVAP